MKLFITVILQSSIALAFTSISSVHNGMQLSNENGLARTTAWNESNKIEFSGYGQIKINELCLHSNKMGFVTWMPCQDGTKAQIWSLKDGILKTELGYCAEVESYTKSVINPRLITKVCKDSKAEQKWKGHE